MADGVRAPGADDPVIPGRDGGEWTEVGYEQWISHVWAPALEAAGIAVPASVRLAALVHALLLHEGRSVIYVARQLGHSAQLTMRTYGHVIEELEDAPRISAEDAIPVARESLCPESVRLLVARRGELRDHKTVS